MNIHSFFVVQYLDIAVNMLMSFAKVSHSIQPKTTKISFTLKVA